MLKHVKTEILIVFLFLVLFISIIFFNFKTVIASNSSVSFLVVADYHIDQSSYGNIGNIRTWQSNLYEYATKENVDFVFVLGDFVHVYGGDTTAWQNFTLECNNRQDILTFGLQGDHEHAEDKHVNYSQVTDLPPFYSFTIKDIQFIAFGSWYMKHAAPEEFKVFSEYVLNQTSLTTVFITQNAIYNTTSPENDNMGSKAANHYYIDSDWWQRIITNYSVPLFIHANNHAHMGNASRTLTIEKWNCLMATCGTMFQGTTPAEQQPYATKAVITGTQITVSKVNLNGYAKTILATKSLSTSLDVNAEASFTVGGRIQHNQTENVYNHYVSDSTTLYIGGDSLEGNLKMFTPFRYVNGTSGGQGGMKPVPFDLVRTGGTTDYQWQWNGTYPDRSLDINFSYDGSNQILFHSQNLQDSGAYGYIEAAKDVKYNVTFEMMANVSTIDYKPGVKFFDHEGNAFDQYKASWTSMPTSYANCTFVPFGNSADNVTAMSVSVKFRNSGRIWIKDFSCKQDGATTQTQDAYVSVNGTSKGTTGTLTAFQSNSYALTNQWQCYNLTANIGGCKVALWRMVFNDFKGFVLHNSVEYDGAKWQIKEDRNPYTTLTRIFFVDSNQPRVSVLYGEIESFTSPVYAVTTSEEWTLRNLSLTVTANAGKNSTVIIYTNGLGIPDYVSGASSWSYNVTTYLVTLNITHSSSEILDVSWQGWFIDASAETSDALIVGSGFNIYLVNSALTFQAYSNIEFMCNSGIWNATNGTLLVTMDTGVLSFIPVDNCTLNIGTVADRQFHVECSGATLTRNEGNYIATILSGARVTISWRFLPWSMIDNYFMLGVGLTGIIMMIAGPTIFARTFIKHGLDSESIEWLGYGMLFVIMGSGFLVVWLWPG